MIPAKAGEKGKNRGRESNGQWAISQDSGIVRLYERWAAPQREMDQRNTEGSGFLRQKPEVEAWGLRCGLFVHRVGEVL